MKCILMSVLSLSHSVTLTHAGGLTSPVRSLPTCGRALSPSTAEECSLSTSPRPKLGPLPPSTRCPCPPSWLCQTAQPSPACPVCPLRRRLQTVRTASRTAVRTTGRQRRTGTPAARAMRSRTAQQQSATAAATASFCRTWTRRPRLNQRALTLRRLRQACLGLWRLDWVRRAATQVCVWRPAQRCLRGRGAA